MDGVSGVVVHYEVEVAAGVAEGVVHNAVVFVGKHL